MNGSSRDHERTVSVALESAAEGAIGRPLRCLLAELRDVADWIERTKPQGLLYDSARPAMREAATAISAMLATGAVVPSSAKPVAGESSRDDL